MFGSARRQTRRQVPKALKMNTAENLQQIYDAFAHFEASQRGGLKFLESLAKKATNPDEHSATFHI